MEYLGERNNEQPLVLLVKRKLFKILFLRSLCKCVNNFSVHVPSSSPTRLVDVEATAEPEQEPFQLLPEFDRLQVRFYFDSTNLFCLRAETPTLRLILFVLVDHSTQGTPLKEHS